MNVDQLVSLVTTMLAISLAAERLVTTLKSAFPSWLAEEKKTAVNGEDKVGDGPRRAWVIVFAFIAAYITSALVADNHWNPIFVMQFGTEPHDTKLPLVVVALLATGGSAMWNDLLGYTKAVKDIRGQDREQQALALHQQAQATGIPVDPAGRGRMLPDSSPKLQAALSRLGGKPQPTFPR